MKQIFYHNAIQFCRVSEEPEKNSFDKYLNFSLLEKSENKGHVQSMNCTLQSCDLHCSFDITNAVDSAYETFIVGQGCQTFGALSPRILFENNHSELQIAS